MEKRVCHDLHTLSSVYTGIDEYGHDQWNTTRSEMGDLVYQLKYEGNTSTVPNIVDLLGEYKGLEMMDAIIPAPSTNQNRLIQPVCAIARELGKRLKIQVIEDVLQKRPGAPQVKNVEDQEEREALLRATIVLTEKHDLVGKHVLLLDDLYRSGATLNVATDILYDQAKCSSVYVLTMTKTRNRR